MEGGLENISPFTRKKPQANRATIGRKQREDRLGAEMAQQPHLLTLLGICFHLPASKRRHL